LIDDNRRACPIVRRENAPAKQRNPYGAKVVFAYEAQQHVVATVPGFWQGPVFAAETLQATAPRWKRIGERRRGHARQPRGAFQRCT
jgi:hypothetical protein